MTVINSKPHLQLGQYGKGKGKKKKPRKHPRPVHTPKPQPGPIPTQMPEVGGFPGMGNPGPDFLPNTPGWEDSRAKLSGNLAGAETAYSIGNQLIPAQLGLQTARLNTDRGYAARDVDEDMAQRGLFTSGIRAQEQQRKVAIPYGRQLQDLGAQAAQNYASLAGDFSGANLSYQSDLYDALMQRANDAYQAQPLGASAGSWQAPDQAGFVPSYPPKGPPKPKKGKKKGKK